MFLCDEDSGLEGLIKGIVYEAEICGVSSWISRSDNNANPKLRIFTKEDLNATPYHGLFVHSRDHKIQSGEYSNALRLKALDRDVNGKIHVRIINKPKNPTGPYFCVATEKEVGTFYGWDFLPHRALSVVRSLNVYFVKYLFDGDFGDPGCWGFLPNKNPIKGFLKRPPFASEKALQKNSYTQNQITNISEHLINGAKHHCIDWPGLSIGDELLVHISEVLDSGTIIFNPLVNFRKDQDAYNLVYQLDTRVETPWGALASNTYEKGDIIFDLPILFSAEQPRKGIMGIGYLPRSKYEKNKRRIKEVFVIDGEQFVGSYVPKCKIISDQKSCIYAEVIP